MSTITARHAELVALRAKVDAEIRRLEHKAAGEGVRLARRQDDKDREASRTVIGLVEVLKRLDIATRPPRRCCPACGCLLLPAEPCPKCSTIHLAHQEKP